MTVSFTPSSAAVHSHRVTLKEHSDHAAMALVFIALTWIWVMAVGSDQSWDVFNHHVYLPFSLLSGRFATDLLAAGPQSYQNPIGYVPFYLLTQAGLPAWAVGTVLTIVHALSVLPLVSIVQSIWGTDSQTRLWRWLAVAMAWASPVYLLTVGTSSVDPLGHLLVLLALAAALAPKPRTSHLLASAAGLGLSVAIKPTTALFALAIGAVLVMRWLAREMAWRQVLGFVSVAFLALLVFWGPWAYWLWMRFHNPLFPLYNEVFQSPFAWTQAVVDRRFLPEDWRQWVLRPLLFAQTRRFATTEAFAPDLRPLALSVVVVAGAVWAFARALRRQPLRLESGTHATRYLVVFAAVAFVLWMKLSGNARYALPLLAVAGVLLVRGLQTLLPQRWARSAVLLLLGLQLLNYGLQYEHRFSPTPWTSGPYLDIRVPERLREQPALHLSLGLQTNAAVAAFLHPDGAMINAVGQMSIPPSGPLRDAFDAKVKAWQGRVRFLFLADNDQPPARPALLARRSDRITYGLGLRVDWSDCERIAIFQQSLIWRTLLSCNAVAQPHDDPTYAAARLRADRVFAVVEARCPQAYAPAPLVSDAGLNEWQRRYANTDIRVTIDAADNVVVSHHRSMETVRLGSVDDVISGRMHDPCAAWKLLLNPS
ncbi:MAG: glycosyltransferase 87 family protein [Proteobacteria bacterium]|nr:glycosyltransferase 87 family protein [Pseudomonadota bacterium]